MIFDKWGIAAIVITAILVFIVVAVLVVLIIVGISIGFGKGSVQDQPIWVVIDSPVCDLVVQNDHCFIGWIAAPQYLLVQSKADYPSNYYLALKNNPFTSVSSLTLSSDGSQIVINQTFHRQTFIKENNVNFWVLPSVAWT